MMQDKRDAIRRYENSGIGMRHTRMPSERLREHEGFRVNVERAETAVEEGAIVVFYGDRGVGKTQAGAELIKIFCLRGRGCRYVICREISMRLREGFNGGSKSEMQLLKEFTEPFLLVIDECQEGLGSDYERSSFTLIMDKRYAKMNPTVLIANIEREQTDELFGGSVADRIREGGGCRPFEWESFRGRG